MYSVSQDNPSIVMGIFHVPKVEAHTIINLLVNMDLRAKWDPVFDEALCLEKLPGFVCKPCRLGISLILPLVVGFNHLFTSQLQNLNKRSSACKSQLL